VERRLAITYIVSATATFGIGCVAIAVAGGGLFVSAAPKPAGGKQIEVVDDYIVIHSSTTVAGDVVVAPVDPLAAGSPRAALSRSQAVPAPIVAAAPDTTPVAAPEPTAGAPLVAAPPAAAPAPVHAPVAAPAPTPEAPEPTDPPQAPEPPVRERAPSTTAPSSRPPVPVGCHDPEYDHGTWHCDDD
jgi:2-oxoglutarate dehydrogenase E2 component (dihydrolipoamide succinyltransferase)